MAFDPYRCQWTGVGLGELMDRGQVIDVVGLSDCIAGTWLHILNIRYRTFAVGNPSEACRRDSAEFVGYECEREKEECD